MSQLELIGIKTDRGYVVRIVGTSDFRDYYRINGESGGKLNYPNWRLFKDAPTQLEERKGNEILEDKYILKDTSLASEKIPVEINKSDIQFGERDDDYAQTWVQPSDALRGLYEHKVVSGEEIWVGVPFTYTEVAEVPNLDSFLSVKLGAQGKWNFSTRDYEIKTQELKYDILHELFLPDIMLPAGPCAISSKQMYDVVRRCVKEKIDTKVAEVTSDYDFCFAVAKKIKLAVPYVSTSKIKRRRRYYNSSQSIEFRKQQVFEMTHAQDNYSGYTPIPGVTAVNALALQEEVEAICEEIVALINRPLCECEHCKGAGIIETPGWNWNKKAQV